LWRRWGWFLDWGDRRYGGNWSNGRNWVNGDGKSGYGESDGYGFMAFAEPDSGGSLFGIVCFDHDFGFEFDVGFFF
jgi:hypothetical protein